MMKKNTHSKLARGFEIGLAFMKLRHSNGNRLSNFLAKLFILIELQFLPFYWGEVPAWRLFLRRIISKKRVSPDYVLTGPIKSGSSDLTIHLLLHDHVMLPLSKEIRSKPWFAYFPSVKEKEKLEKKRKGPVRCGYHRPSLHNVELVDDLYNSNANLRIIIALRDPVERAYSHWKWEVLLEGKTDQKRDHLKNYSTFVKRALELYPHTELETCSGHPLLETGIYHKAVERWIKTFGNENILFVDSAEYFDNRQAVLKKIHAFLNIPLMDIPESMIIVNENPLRLEPPNESTILALKEFYRPYNQKLYKLIGTSFDWL